jgi:hypothetical protein
VDLDEQLPDRLSAQACAYRRQLAGRFLSATLTCEAYVETKLWVIVLGGEIHGSNHYLLLRFTNQGI